ncbi:MAG: hypothetical protein ACK5NC_15575 [Vibrio sp.]
MWNSPQQDQSEHITSQPLDAESTAIEQTSAEPTAKQSFKEGYLAARKMMQKIDMDINRSQIIVIEDQGKRIYRPFRWDH